MFRFLLPTSNWEGATLNSCDSSVQCSSSHWDIWGEGGLVNLIITVCGWYQGDGRVNWVNKLTYDGYEGEYADEDGDREENENEGIQFVVTFLNQGFALRCRLERFLQTKCTLPQSGRVLLAALAALYLTLVSGWLPL